MVGVMRVPRLKGLVFLLGGKQGLAAGIACRGGILGNLVRQGRKLIRLTCIGESRTQRNKQQRIIRQNTGSAQHMVKTIAKFRKKG